MLMQRQNIILIFLRQPEWFDISEINVKCNPNTGAENKQTKNSEGNVTQKKGTSENHSNRNQSNEYSLIPSMVPTYFGAVCAEK